MLTVGITSLLNGCVFAADQFIAPAWLPVEAGQLQRGWQGQLAWL